MGNTANLNNEGASSIIQKFWDSALTSKFDDDDGGEEDESQRFIHIYTYLLMLLVEII